MPTISPSRNMPTRGEMSQTARYLRDREERRRAMQNLVQNRPTPPDSTAMPLGSPFNIPSESAQLENFYSFGTLDSMRDTTSRLKRVVPSDDIFKCGGFSFNATKKIIYYLDSDTYRVVELPYESPEGLAVRNNIIKVLISKEAVNLHNNNKCSCCTSQWRCSIIRAISNGWVRTEDPEGEYAFFGEKRKEHEDEIFHDFLQLCRYRGQNAHQQSIYERQPYMEEDEPQQEDTNAVF